MSSTAKTILTNVLKNAVNAALTAAGPTALWPKFFHFHNLEGLEHIASLLGTAVLAREIMVYGPKLLAWSSSTNGNPPTA